MGSGSEGRAGQGAGREDLVFFIMIVERLAGMWFGLLVHVAGAGGGELVGVDEESPVGVARVDRDHPVVDILLGALGLIARGKEAAGRVGCLTGLQPGGLGVVVVSVSVLLGDVLQNDPPVALNIHSPTDLGVLDI